MSNFILFSRFARPTLVVLSAILFFVAPFAFNFNTAQMQTGANNIVFHRYISAHTYKILTVNSDGSNETEIGYGTDPKFSPDGSKIAFVLGNGETSDIYTMNADGSNAVQLTNTYQAHSPAWSPDGLRIAFASSHESGTHVYIINVDGTNQQRLNITDTNLTQEHGPVFTPNGQKIIFLGDKVVNGLGRSDYYQINADNSGEVTQLTFLDAILSNQAPAISPDGTRIVFEYQHDLQAATTDGSGQLINLSNNGSGMDEQASYSPNGAKIVFRRGSQGLFVMNADGSDPVALNVIGSNPMWNPTAVMPPPSPTPTGTPVQTADVAVEMQASAASVQIGQEVTYTIVVRNNGAGTATNVLLTDALPNSLTLVSLSASQGSCSTGSGLACQIGTLGVNAQAIVTLKARVDVAESILNSATATAAEIDPEQGNNTASVTIQGAGISPLDVTGEIRATNLGPTRNSVNNESEMVILVQNTSGRTLSGRVAFVFDNLTEGVTISPRMNPGVTQYAAPLGSPYVLYEANNRNVEWRNGQAIVLRVSFHNPQRVNINYNLRVLNGAGQP
ncbi:MAG TPA: hypothetical protein VEX64_06445 [Pyrinomonadaceae bacterium]|nr:hypothetical protein [Pyrinomonadaceae bacterium]